MIIKTSFGGKEDVEVTDLSHVGSFEFRIDFIEKD